MLNLIKFGWRTVAKCLLNKLSLARRPETSFILFFKNTRGYLYLKSLYVVWDSTKTPVQSEIHTRCKIFLKICKIHMIWIIAFNIILLQKNFCGFPAQGGSISLKTRKFSHYWTNLYMMGNIEGIFLKNVFLKLAHTISNWEVEIKSHLSNYFSFSTRPTS